jgi:translation initiation factor 1
VRPTELPCNIHHTTIQGENLNPQKHQLFFAKQKRRGKTVTLVGEFFMPKEDINKVLKTLKKKLGCGGAFKDNMMEFQGDIKDKVRPLLVDLDFKFKHKH